MCATYRIGHRECSPARARDWLTVHSLEEDVMSLRTLVAAVVMLGAPACLEAPRETAVEQANGLPPSCPAGQSVLFFTVPSGVCGDCRVGHTPGAPEAQYAACSGDIDGTKRLIQILCSTPCELN
jgi:hypothetical protein